LEKRRIRGTSAFFALLDELSNRTLPEISAAKNRLAKMLSKKNLLAEPLMNQEGIYGSDWK
jgi:hypothetical protein